MKRTTKKIFALILSVLMLSSLLVVPAFAEDAEADPYAALKEGIGYLAIGDSFTRGYGAGDNWQDQIYENEYPGNYNCRNVDGSYPNRVADAFGLYAPNDIRDTDAKLWPLAHDAVSTAYVLDLLGIDDGFRDEEHVYSSGSMLRRYAADLQYFGDPASYTIDGTATYGQTGEIMSVRDMIKNASLITIGLGQTDVIYKTQIFGLNTMDLSDTSAIPAGVANILKLFNQYFDYWKGAYPILLDYIKQVNPTAKVVLVGTLNPIKDATITDDVAIPIGNLINFMMDSVNSYTQMCAAKYGYIYVDINDVETPASATTMSIGHILSIEDDIEYALIAHPTQKGYKQIADKIIKAVQTELKTDSMKGVKEIKDFYGRLLEWFRKLCAMIKAVFNSMGDRIL